MGENNNADMIFSSKCRNGALDALRCCLMFFIVMLHCYYHSRYDASDYWWTLLFNGFFLFHVDAFAALTGWFGCRFSFRKIGKLMGVVLWYQVMSVIVSPSCFFKFQMGGWYVSAYLFLILLAPLLNAGIESLISKFGRKSFMFCVVLVCAFELYAWLPTYRIVPFSEVGIGNHSVVLLLLIYVCTRMVRLNGFQTVIVAHQRWFFLIFICGLFGTGAVVMAYRSIMGMHNSFCVLAGLTSNAAPHVFIFAIALVVMVSACSCHPLVGRVASFCAPSMLGVYLMHNATSFTKILCQFPQEWLHAHTNLNPCLIVAGGGVFVFTVCMLADFGRRAILCPFVGFLDERFKRMDEQFETFMQRKSI